MNKFNKHGNHDAQTCKVWFSVTYKIEITELKPNLLIKH